MTVDIAVSATTFTWELTGDGTMLVTLNRPGRLNALSATMQGELTTFWRAVREQPEVRVIVLTGAGRAFCAGADTSELEDEVHPSGSIGVAALEFCPGRVLDVPVIVALNGLCIGGGLNFIADADIVIASEEAWLSDPHVTMGQVSGPEVLQLAAKVGPRAVTQLALSGSRFRMSAERALQAGLVNEVVATAALPDRAREVAEAVAAQSPTAVRRTLAILRRRARAPIADELDHAWSAVVAQWTHPDSLEGPTAFVEKRAPRWLTPEVDRS
jgi:enoyl-CoA hydratase/carnithine racemase